MVCVPSQDWLGKCTQTLATLAASLLAVSQGMHVGWSSPVIPRLLSEMSPVNITLDHVVWIENAYIFGSLFGLGFTMYLVNKIGRKRTILTASANSILSWTLIAFAVKPWMLLLGRFFGGISGNIFYVSFYVYVSEISDKTIRGGLGSLGFIMTQFGIFVVYCIGPYIEIFNICIVGAAISVVQFILFLVMPESPYYLLTKVRINEAEKTLKILRHSGDVREELTEIYETVNKENMRSSKMIDLFKIKSNRKALLIVTILGVAQEFSGKIAFIMNLETILNDASSVGKGALLPVIFALVVGISGTAGGILMDFLGRRKLLIISCFSTSFLLFAIAVHFSVINSTTDMERFFWILAVVIMLYTITQTCGMALVPSFFASELFPTNVKVYGCSLSEASYLIGSSLSIFMYNFIANSVRMGVPFYVYGVCSACEGIFVIFFVPETKGKNLQEIQAMLKGEQERNGYSNARNFTAHENNENV